MNQQLKKRLWIIHHVFAVLFGIALVYSMFGCSIPLYRVEITPTTPLTQEEVDMLSYQYALKHSPERILAMPACQWQAMQKYFRLKEGGYEACILIGRSNKWGNQKHLEATTMKDGVPIDLKGMQVTHVITENTLWRIGRKPNLDKKRMDEVFPGSIPIRQAYPVWQDQEHEQWLRYGR